ncbi:hypothetical protein AVEN_236241-1 [Araneus ventricosus]|uniref:Uncharacterized protein n=1 Tax=Araneus ventricosus TaxID=182803 RepID=A0A4Y2CC34_ARAVE|nr:hypothetical protein AVEN_236241-1 [Araneus ventricosus]
MSCPKGLLRLNYSAPYLFQCDHPSRGPHIASCTQHSRRLKVTCHQKCSAQPIKCCPLRSSRSESHQDRSWTHRKRRMRGEWTCRMLCTGCDVWSTKRVVTLKDHHMPSPWK